MKAFASLMVVVLAALLPAASFADGPPPANPATPAVNWDDPNVVGQSMTGMFQAMTRLMERIDANTAAIQELKKSGAGDNGDGAYIRRAFGDDAVALARSRACGNDASALDCIAFEESYKTPSMRRAIAVQYVREMREGTNATAEIGDIRRQIVQLKNELKNDVRSVAHDAATVSNKKKSKEERLEALRRLARF